MTGSRRRTYPTFVVVLLVLASVASARASENPGYEVLWSRGGMSAPYELEAFHGQGTGLFAAGYTGGVVAVGTEGVRWRFSDGSQLAGATFADVTGDGVDDALLAVYPDSLVAIEGVTGTPLAKHTFARVPEGVTTGHADADGNLDVYAVTQSVSGTANTVSLLDGRTLTPRWTQTLSTEQQYVLAIDSDDITGDGRDDVVFGTYSNGPKVYAYGSDGTKLWQADIGGVVSNIEITDGGASVLATRTGAQLSSLDAKTGATRWTLAGNGGFSLLDAADLDGDGADDAVWALYGSSGKSPSWQVMAVSGASGLPLWTVPTVAPPKGLAIGDIDDDGAPDVVATTQDVSSDVREAENFVWAIQGRTGRPLWTHVLSGDATTFLSDVTFADVTGDSRREIVVAPYFERLLGLSPTDGSRVWSADIGSASLDAIAVDLDGDGADEVVEGSSDFTLTSWDGATGASEWSRDLGGEVSAISAVGAGAGHDLIVASQAVVHRVRGTSGAVLWSRPLDGMGTDTELIERPGQPPLVAVGVQLKRVNRGLGHSSIGGSLWVFDAVSGLPKWHMRVAGTPWDLVAEDANGDGVKDLVAGSPAAQQAVTVYDGAHLDTAPVPLWLTQGDSGVSGLAVTGGRVVSVRTTTKRVVAQNGATGAEVWSYTHPVAIRSLGFEDLTGDGVRDVLLGTETFSERIVGINGATGQKLFEVAAGIRFVKAASWADVSGDGAADLVYSSDGGTFGKGGVFAIDGTTLGSTPVRLWSYERINAWGLQPLELSGGTAWLAFGVTTLPDAVTVLRPLPA